ncbi:MAG TPA: toll/interleukin-1 receptor domain-containing protein [Anaerolineales bacterium]
MTTTNRPLRVFLCHSSNDKPAVRELYQKLRAEAWLEPWLDEEELYPGQDWNLEIEKAVEAADAIIVCLSKGSITKEGYVQKEIKTALDYADYKPEGTLFIIPVRLEECEPPRRLRAWQYADYFEGQRERAFGRLLVSLKRRAEALNVKFETLPVGRVSNPKETVVPNLTYSLGTKRKVEEGADWLAKRKVEEERLERIRIESEQNAKEETQHFLAQESTAYLFSWWARILLAILLEFSLFFFIPFSSDPMIPILVTGIIAGFLTYPNKFSIVPLIAGSLLGPPVMWNLFDKILATYSYSAINTYGEILGILIGALVSRILYWLKTIK